MTGWSRLLRLGLRRDRVLVPVWVLAMALVVLASVRATVDLYPTRAERLVAGQGVNGSAALVAFYGPIADPGSVGGVATFKLLLLGGVFVALLAVIVVRRHTRLEEESARAELLVAAGRHALLTAAVVEAVGAVLLLSLLTMVGGIASGLPVIGTFAFGAAWFALGVAAAGLTALAAQVSASTRTVGVLVGSVLGISYALRAVGDVDHRWGWLTWLSPFGWLSHLRVYGSERWWVLVLPLALCAGTTAAACGLAAQRDLGQGLVAARPGPARGRLRGVVALTCRLQAGAVAGSVVALAALGALVGAVLPSVGQFAGSAAVRRMLERVGGRGRLEDTFVATEIAFVAVGLAAMGVAAVVRLAAEEESGRVAVVLAAAVSRTRLLLTTAFLAVVWPLLAALAFGLTTSLTVGRDLVVAALSPLPAVWLVSALALLLLGLRRAWAGLGWALLALFLLLGQVGDLLSLPHWLLAVSPFDHVPAMPSEAFAWGPEVALTALAVAVGSVAFWCYREREVEG